MEFMMIVMNDCDKQYADYCDDDGDCDDCGCHLVAPMIYLQYCKSAFLMMLSMMIINDDEDEYGGDFDDE